MTRTQNSFFNMISSLGANLLVVVLNFVTRSVFISCLGTSFLGIEGYFSNVLTMLSLAELGFGTAIVYKLYKPIEQQDHRRILALMKLYRQIYRIIGCLIMLMGLCLIPLLPYLVKDYEKFAQLGLNAVVVFLMYLFNSASSYWFFAYKTSFVYANQKTYVLTTIGYAITIATSVCQILALVLTHNFLVYLATQIFFCIFRNLVYSTICDKRYPYLREKTTESVSREERRQIFKDCYALFLHRANGVVIEASDNIVLSALAGLDAVGLYSNYLALKLALRNILLVFTDSIQSSVGSIYSTGNLEWTRLIWRIVNFIAFWLYGIGAIGLAILANDFITIWPAVGPDFVVTQWVGNNGVTYAVPLALLMGIELYFYGQTRYCGVFRVSLGLFQPLKYRPIASILVNLAVSIATVPYWGMGGCVVGTIVSALTTDLLIDPWVIHKHALKKSPLPYYLKNVLYTCVVLVAGVLSWWLCRLVTVSGLLGFLIHGVICVVVPCGVFTLCFFSTEEFRYLVGTVKTLLLKKPADPAA
jgi:O-antigen/teichoic acid export membrane protein